RITSWRRAIGVGVALVGIGGAGTVVDVVADAVVITVERRGPTPGMQPPEHPVAVAVAEGLPHDEEITLRIAGDVGQHWTGRTGLRALETCGADRRPRGVVQSGVYFLGAPIPALPPCRQELSTGPDRHVRAKRRIGTGDSCVRD